MEILLRLYFIGTIFFFLFYLVILVKAFQDTIGQGLLCLLVPFYILYFAFVRMETNKKGLLLGAWIVTGLTGPILGIMGPTFIKRDACKLITNAEVGAALGEPIERSEESSPTTPFGIIDSCTYATGKTPEKSVLVAVEPKCASLDEVRKAAAAQLVSVFGLGDEAYFGGSELTARKGNSCIYVMITDESFRHSLSGFDKMNVSKSVAEKVFERLP